MVNDKSRKDADTSEEVEEEPTTSEDAILLGQELAEENHAAEQEKLAESEEEVEAGRESRVEGELPAKPTQLPAEENTTVGKNRTKK
jgi:hypothetical protein